MDKTLAPAVDVLAEPELIQLESVVREGTGAFMRVGLALMQIRDGKGYKLRGFKTFEAYCEKTFGITDRHGRRLIAATEASQQIEAAIGVAPASESVARELVNVARDPVVLQKVKDRLEKKKTTVASASAELVKEVVATVTGKLRPEKSEPHKPTPRPAAAPAPAADDVTTLQATLTAVRSFLVQHPWLKDDAVARKRVAQIDEGLLLLERLLAGSFAHVGSRPGGRPEQSGAPRCPHCKEPIEAGAVFCDKCGTVL